MLKMLIINPGSTSTKIAVYDNNNPIFTETLSHSSEEISKFNNIFDQYEFRKDFILKSLKEHGINIESLNAVVGRGGLLKAIEGGTYAVNQTMINDLKIGIQGQHASNLGGVLAYEIAQPQSIPAFIVDPVVVDEMDEIAYFSGMPEIKRKSIFHALNQKAVAKRFALEINEKYEELNLIVVHMGGGITVGVHKKGRVIDVNNGLDGDGPFSPERTGSIPVGDLVKLCFSGEYSIDKIKSMITGKGGIVAYLETNDAREVEKMIEAGNLYAKSVYEAMAYQIAKEIGSGATVLKGQIDSIILTGGIAYSKMFTKLIEDRVGFLASVKIYPGEDEMLALAEGCLRVLSGQELVKDYK